MSCPIRSASSALVVGREPGHELAAVVALVHLRLDAAAGGVRAHVDVSAQADGGPAVPGSVAKT